jgi:hypothetical protein
MRIATQRWPRRGGSGTVHRASWAGPLEKFLDSLQLGGLHHTADRTSWSVEVCLRTMSYACPMGRYNNRAAPMVLSAIPMTARFLVQGDAKRTAGLDIFARVQRYYLDPASTLA